MSNGKETYSGKEAINDTFVSQTDTTPHSPSNHSIVSSSGKLYIFWKFLMLLYSAYEDSDLSENESDTYLIHDWEVIDVSTENPNLLLTSGSILTTDRAMQQNQKIKIMDRAKEDYLKYKDVNKRLKIAKFIALFFFFLIQIFSVPRWCIDNKDIKDETW